MLVTALPHRAETAWFERARKATFRNDRVRDAADVLLFIESFRSREQLVGVREACERVFESRDRHTWPPEFSPPERWRGEYERLASDLNR